MNQCPRCGGLLPSTGDRFCPNCGAEVPVSSAPPPPLPTPLRGAGPSAPPPGAGAAWERRDQLGFVPAIFDTIKGVLFSPAQFFRTMAKQGGIGGPLGYGIIVGYVGLLIATMYNALVTVLFGSSLRGLDDGPLAQIAPYLQGGVGFVSQVIFGPIWLLIGIFVSAGIYHVVLMILGQAKQGFETSLRVVCYSQSAAILQLVPFCGGLAMAVWMIVCNIVGLSEAHGIGRGSAAIAVLAPIVLFCCCCGLGLMALFGGIAGIASQAH